MKTKELNDRAEGWSKRIAGAKLGLSGCHSAERGMTTALADFTRLSLSSEGQLFRQFASFFGGRGSISSMHPGLGPALAN
ncbi:hypothetical protein [Hymenobacter sp. UYCo722]|uniref:hypothetical protein n=1 Tax=Hymenobacter sp. UYCo722 TaxID=3156335 RepID=UPI00339780E5